MGVLEEVRTRYVLVVHGYVVMPEHIHLLLTEPQVGTISTVMQALKLGFARRVLYPHFSREMGHPVLGVDTGEAAGRNQKKGPHHIWQKRFYDFNVWTEKKRIEKLRYIHRNPVVRGLAASPEEWCWSSFRFYADGEAGLVRVNDWEILKLRVREAAVQIEPGSSPI
jgi:putative transposase